MTIKTTPATVPELLAAVDYGVDTNYIPSDFAIKLINFIKLMTDGKGEASPTPVMHFKMLDLLPYPTSNRPHQRVAVMAARGTSKTSILSEILILYVATFGGIDGFDMNITGIIYVSDTIENGVKSLKKNIQARYDSSEFLQKYVPITTFNQTELYFENIDGKKLGVRMFGAATGLRGTKIFAERPQLAILDDLLSDKNAKSDGIIENINDTLYKGVNQALDPTRRKIIFVGTPFNEGDPLYNAIESGAWKCAVFPICEKFPVDEAHFKGAWDSRFSFGHIESEYLALKASGQAHAFYQEMMLEIGSNEERAVEEVDIRWFQRREVLENLDKFTIVITTDFATSEAKSADYNSISVWAINSSGHMFWLDGILERQGMLDTLNDLFRLCDEYSPTAVGIEINGQQGGFIPWIEQEMITRDIYFPLAMTYNSQGKPTRIGILSPNTSNKLERFNVILPDIKTGKLHLPITHKDEFVMVQAVKQLLGVTKNGMLSRNDDWLDSLTQLALMSTYLPRDGTLTPPTTNLGKVDYHLNPFAFDDKSSSGIVGTSINNYLV